MNYLKVYCKLVRKFEERNLTREEGNELFEYCEEHHIWMRSIYGQEKDGNTRTIIVSGREHFILHAVLEKAFIKRYGLHHWKTIKATNAVRVMKTYKRYYNSHIYEKTKIRNRRQKAHPIRIYFEDGRVIDWYEGTPEFCRENPQYNTAGLCYLKQGKYTRHKDIIKIEKINRENPSPIKPFIRVEPILKSAKKVRIYFADGRVIVYEKGLANFCRENPEYSPCAMGKVLNNIHSNHKDIIKVEYIDKKKRKEKWVRKTAKYPMDLFVPVMIYFDDGTSIECREGLSHFSRESNRYYKSHKLLLLLRGERNICKNIMKIVKLSNEIEVPPTRVSPRTGELIKINPLKIDYTIGDY